MSIIASSEDASLRAAANFAETAHEWILTDSIDQLEQGVEILLLGSAKYIQVDYQDHLLIDSRAEGWGDTDLHLPVVLPTKAIASTVTLQDHRIIETVIPIRDRAFTVGFVRIGTYVQQLAPRLQRTTWIIGAISIALWLLSAGMTVLATVRLARRDALTPSQENPASYAPIRELFTQRPIVIDLQARTISRDGTSRQLTPKPFGLLSLLISRSSHVFSDSEIMEAIWPDCRYTSANDVHQCVYRLRKLLNDIEPGLGQCIANVKGYGYRFEIDERVELEGASFETARTQ